MELNPNELKFISEIKTFMKNGCILSDMLDEVELERKRLNISEDRAIALKHIAMHEEIQTIQELKTEEEREYYESFLKRISSGSISNSARMALNKKKEILNISDERCSEIESLSNFNIVLNENIQSNSIISSDNDVFKNEQIDSDVEIIESKKKIKKFKKNKKSNISHLDKTEQIAKSKHPFWLKIYIWLVIVGIEIALIKEYFNFIHNKNTYSLFTKCIQKIQSWISLEPVAQANDLISNIIIFAFFLVLLILLFIILKYLPAFFSAISTKRKKEAKKDYKISTVFFGVVLIAFTYIFIMEQNKELRDMEMAVKANIKSGNFIKAYESIKNTKKGNNNKVNDDARKIQYDILATAVTNKYYNMLNSSSTTTSDRDYILNQIIYTYTQLVKDVAHRDTYDKAMVNLSEQFFIKFINLYGQNGEYNKGIEILDDPGKYISGAKNDNVKRWISYLPFIKDASKRTEITQRGFEDLLTIMHNDLSVRMNTEMNKENYDFIVKNIVPYVGKLSKEVKKDELQIEKEQIKEYLSQLDSSRDEYLEKLCQDIENSIGTLSNEELLSKIELIYHHSQEKKDDTKKKFWKFDIPFTGLTYKEHWEVIKSYLLSNIG